MAFSSPVAALPVEAGTTWAATDAAASRNTAPMAGREILRSIFMVGRMQVQTWTGREKVCGSAAGTFGERGGAGGEWAARGSRIVVILSARAAFFVAIFRRVLLEF